MYNVLMYEYGLFQNSYGFSIYGIIITNIRPSYRYDVKPYTDKTAS